MAKINISYEDFEQQAIDIMGFDVESKVQELIDRLVEQAKAKVAQEYVENNNLMDTALEAKVSSLKKVEVQDVKETVGLDGLKVVPAPLQGV